MRKIRIALGGSGVETHIHTIIQTVQRADTKGEFEIFYLPDRKSFYSALFKFDIYHELFGYAAFKRFFACKLFGHKTICHWTGSDVLLALKNPERTRFTAKFVDRQLVAYHNLMAELQPLGIQAIEWVLPTLNFENAKIYPLPDQFTILAYLPAKNHRFYGSEIIFRLAQECNEINFIILTGGSHDFPTLKNIQYYGWIPSEEWPQQIEKIYQQTSLLIRATPHDSSALMVIEALARGRQVIFSAYPREYCHYATDYNSIKNKVLTLQKNIQPNLDGARFVQAKYQPQVLAQQLLTIYRELYKQ
ncbi:glycosyltransferase [candidate division KSB1 bacterium]|nr:glycosyltransferase [candidate division KSB1 bacterium]